MNTLKKRSLKLTGCVVAVMIAHFVHGQTIHNFNAPGSLLLEFTNFGIGGPRYSEAPLVGLSGTRGIGATLLNTNPGVAILKGGGFSPTNFLTASVGIYFRSPIITVQTNPNAMLMVGWTTSLNRNV